MPFMRTPSNRTVPPETGAMPMMALRVLLLPAPLEPTSASVSPSSTVSEMPCVARTLP